MVACESCIAKSTINEFNLWNDTGKPCIPRGGESQFGEMAEQIHYGNIARQLFPTLF